MLIYEVNLQIDNDVAEEVAVWMRAHVRDMLGFDGFERVAWYQRDPADGRQHWTMHYHVATGQQLNAYLDTHASAMRQDMLDRFSGRFSAERRILYLRETFS